MSLWLGEEIQKVLRIELAGLPTRQGKYVSRHTHDGSEIANIAVVQQARRRVWNLSFIQAGFLGCN
jgi:hypothetical protein